MTNPNLVELICVIDRSGSMSSIKNDAEGGINTFIDEQRKNVKDKTVKVTLVQFDTEYEPVWESKDITKCEHYTLIPRGGTALLDAIGKTINDVGLRLAKTEEHQRPSQIIFMVVTDGEENSSREFTKEKIRLMIEHQRTKYAWDFMFLGTTETAIQDSRVWGFTKSAQYDYGNTRAMYTAMANNISCSINSGSDVYVPDKI